MTFTSWQFIVFFALFLPLYICTKERCGLRLLILVAASAIFYGWWDWRFLFLIAFTGVIDFVLSQVIAATQCRFVRKLCVLLSLACGLGALCLFKYSTFFAGELSSFCGLFGIEVDLASRIPPFCLVLPVGISFYTFQSLSYTIDVYRGKLKPTRNIVHYFAYLMLFPQLVAGPIVRATDLLWKLRDPPSFTEEKAWRGIRLCVCGFFKKCLIADNLAVVVDEAFANVLAMDGSLFWWLTMISFGIQIYCDFSGYSDIARGLIELMGYRFDVNFDHPYSAVSMRDFWRRWHISLSSWFRDYVYIPLGGSRHGKAVAVCNTWITFLLSGLWHGAGWNFVVWGGCHAFGLSLERVLGYGAYFERRMAGFGWILVQIQVLFAWVFFRAQSVGEGLHIVKNMICFMPSRSFDEAALGFVCCFMVFELPQVLKIDRHVRWWKMAEPFAMALLAALALFCRGEGHAFIYFQF